MIEYKSRIEEIEQLQGKFVFHASKGCSVHFSMPAFNNSSQIGRKLGKVTEIQSINRIFYLSEDGSQKYVSLAGIGYICSSETEANELESLASKYKTKVDTVISELSLELKIEIENLTVKST